MSMKLMVSVVALTLLVGSCSSASIPSGPTKTEPITQSTVTLISNDIVPPSGSPLYLGTFSGEIPVKFELAPADLSLGRVMAWACLSRNLDTIIFDSCHGKDTSGNHGTTKVQVGMSNSSAVRNISQTNYVRSFLVVGDLILPVRQFPAEISLSEINGHVLLIGEAIPFTYTFQ